MLVFLKAILTFLFLNVENFEKGHTVTIKSIIKSTKKETLENY